MFKKEERLRKKKEYDRLFKNGKADYGEFFGIKIIQNEGLKNKISVIVGIKISKKAVERNRIKRQIREILKNEAPRLRKGHDLAIVTLAPIMGVSFRDIERAVVISLKKLGLYEKF